jgi:hypothetical protein
MPVLRVGTWKKPREIRHIIKRKFLNMTVPGFVAHQSVLKGGELLKIPQYQL